MYFALSTMYYPDEVRNTRIFRYPGEIIRERELAMAKDLIENLATPFALEKYRYLPGKTAGDN